MEGFLFAMCGAWMIAGMLLAFIGFGKKNWALMLIGGLIILASFAGYVANFPNCENLNIDGGNKIILEKK